MPPGGKTRLQGFAHHWPRLYLALVVCVACLGFVYLAAFPALTVLLLLDLPGLLTTAGSPAEWALAAGEALAAAAAVLVSYQLARIRFPLPGRHPVEAAEAPALFQLIEELRRVYGSPAIHRVCLKSDFVLELVRTPTSGFPLRYTNTLLIGLPVLLSLSPQQFKTALARKIGQLSLTQNPLTGRIYHLRQVWKQYRKIALADSAAAYWVLDAFFSWYSPLFSYLSFYAARRDELEGDSYSLDICSDVDVLESMFAMETWKRFVQERFWPAVYSSDKCPRAPFADMETAIRRGMRKSDAERWLSAACAEHPGDTDTLPPLRERMEAIGHAQYWLPAASGQSAASAYLGPSAPRFVESLNREWLRKSLPFWKQSPKNADPDRTDQRLSVLREHIRRASLSDREALEYALIAERQLDPQSAAALHKELLAINRNNPQLNFVVGRFLLARWDPAGVTALRTAMELDKSCVLPARRVIEDFLNARKTAPS